MNSENTTALKHKALHDMRKHLRRLKMILEMTEENEGEFKLSQSECAKVKNDFNDSIIALKNAWDNNIHLF